MPGSWLSDPDLHGPVSGLISAFNILAEALVAVKIIDSTTLATLLEEKAKEYRKTRDPAMIGAATVLDRLIEPLRAADRVAARQLLQDPPKGTA